jgi:hypothetical protein
MSYVICQERGNLTVVHYYLDLDGKFYTFTNSARKFETLVDAVKFARGLQMVDLYIKGPRGGRYRVRLVEREMGHLIEEVGTGARPPFYQDGDGKVWPVRILSKSRQWGGFGGRGISITCFEFRRDGVLWRGQQRGDNNQIARVSRV